MNLAESANKYMYEDDEVEVTLSDTEEEETSVSATSADEEEGVEEFNPEDVESISPETLVMNSPEAFRHVYGKLYEEVQKITENSKKLEDMLEKFNLESYSYNFNQIRNLLDDIESVGEGINTIDYTLKGVLDTMFYKKAGIKNEVRF